MDSPEVILTVLLILKVCAVTVFFILELTKCGPTWQNLCLNDDYKRRTVDLKKVDGHILRQIVNKFTADSGARFYRSCRGAKEFVDLIKPAWPLEYSELQYSRILGEKLRVNVELVSDYSATIGFFRIEAVRVDYFSAAHIRTDVLPKIQALMSVGMLEIPRYVPAEDVRLLLEAAKPKCVKFMDEGYEPTSAIFKNIKNLEIEVSPANADSYWTTKRVFEVGRNRKTIELGCSRLTTEQCMTIARRFLTNWLMGESTGALERLSMWYFWFCDSDIFNILYDPAIQTLVKSCVETSNCYIVEGALGRVQICIDRRQRLVFQFS